MSEHTSRYVTGRDGLLVEVASGEVASPYHGAPAAFPEGAQIPGRIPGLGEPYASCMGCHGLSVSHTCGQFSPGAIADPERQKANEEFNQALSENIDNWAHRSAKMTCSTCMWYVMKRNGKLGTELGRCRRRAPTMNGFPVMYETDWCGDHKLDEEKA